MVLETKIDNSYRAEIRTIQEFRRSKGYLNRNEQSWQSCIRFPTPAAPRSDKQVSFPFLRLLFSIEVISRKLEFVHNHPTEIAEVEEPLFQRIVSSGTVYQQAELVLRAPKPVFLAPTICLNS